MRKPVSNRQYLDTEILIVTIDNSGTPTVSVGNNQVTAVRSDGSGTRDRLTITFKKPMFGKTPSWVFQPSTVDLTARDIAGTSDKTALVLDFREMSDPTAAVTDGAGTFIIFGPTVDKEGNY